MKSFILGGIILLLVSVVAVINKDNFIVAPYGSPSQENWWKRNPIFGYPSYSYWEAFESKPLTTIKKSVVHNSSEDPLLQYAPDTPSPVTLDNNQPYHLLNDIMQPPRFKESISCVNSRSCYATDFQRMLEKTGTHRQMTNNYKRDYPDSCTSPIQELVLNFYKHDAMPVPVNNTG